MKRNIYVQKVLIIALMIPTVLLGQYLNEVYRPKAYANDGMNSFIAGSASGFFTLILMVLFFELFRKKFSFRLLRRDILKIGAFYNVVEMASYFLSWLGTFDIMDMVVYSLATGFMYLMANLLFRKSSSTNEVSLH
ncbi:MAG: hypothetical protein COW03_02590 [Cytophagales bacterium CG12_big_fil_rev_8_21_14_0_65_40_12]|nr:MAG: hypothetical protein COW03_02590 [Cytophagales bacterium CG12_big_fil_rev_8_21_14_0_65_40_12]PIW03431.1 MAG: hypothetical protein COW40_14835 [Cytophagales bacterium CG17_big_fil_post_rev_8_21_14_2_50_40_13]